MTDKIKTVSVLVLVVLAPLAYVVYNYLSVEPSKTTPSKPVSIVAAPANNQSIAVLGQQNTNNSATNTPSSEAEEVSGDTSSKEPYKIELPAGWALVDTVTSPNPCDEKIEQKIDTYKNDKETLLIYENGDPRGCDNSVLADTYIDFDFSDDGKSLRLNDLEKLAFCTKEENPACPKGDGIVSIFIGNEDTNQGRYVKNKITGKTYYFSITDTKLDADLDTQVRSLASLVEAIKFN